jgi:peptide/nickel transport system substrate-binding protein
MRDWSPGLVAAAAEEDGPCGVEAAVRNTPRVPHGFAVEAVASQLINIYFGCQYFIANSKVNGNIAEFCDPQLDASIHNALAAEANNSPDVGRLWAQSDRIVTDDAPLVPLVVPGYILFVSKRVANFQASASQGVLQDQLWVR